MLAHEYHRMGPKIGADFRRGYAGLLSGFHVGAQAAIWEQIKTARSKGLATLLISADLDELIGLSDVIVVMFRGKIVATLDPSNISPRELGGYMTGSSAQEQPT